MKCYRAAAVLLVVVWGLGSTLAARAAPAPGSSYASDFAAFAKEVDQRYPFLDLKGIRADWDRAKKELAQRAGQCQSDEEFLGIVYDAVRTLRDGHMGVARSRARRPEFPVRYYPGVSFLPATNGRVVVMVAPEAYAATLKTGTVVTKIDGTDARRYLDDRAKAAWSGGGFFSSPERAALFEYRIALRGQKGEKHTITCLVDGQEKQVDATADLAARGWPHTYHRPEGLKRVGRSFYYAKLDGDVGYVYLRRVDRSAAPGIDEALKAHPGVVGWIVDLRGNGGGGYDAALIDRIKRFPRPVAVVIDAGCASAGETLARDFRRYADARLFGSKTAGSSSSKRTWTFPSGIASLVIPTRSRWRADRKPIELNGIDPDVQVEAVPEEVAAGKNSATLRAKEYLLREAGETRRQ